MSSNNRTTTLMLQALVRADPHNPLIPGTVRSLMRVRQDGHWRTTQESAVALLALAEYINTSGIQESDYTYQAMLDGDMLREGSISHENLEDRITIAASATSEPRSLTLTKQGSGTLYYSISSCTYQDTATIEPVDHGFVLERDYLTVDPITLLPTNTKAE